MMHTTFLGFTSITEISTTESNSVFAFSTSWIVVIELALFLGFLISTFVVLNSV